MVYIGATELSLILPAHVSIGTNTDPLTLGEVASMIFEVGAELDGVAGGRGYVVPVLPAATISFAQMQMAVKNGVGWRVLRVIFPAIGGHGDDTSIAADYRDAYKAFRTGLKDGSVMLIDAGVSAGEGGRALPRSFSTSHAAASRGDNLASAFLPMGWEP